MSESLAEALPKEQARVREILSVYDSIPGGALAASMMRSSLAEAERAAAYNHAQYLPERARMMQDWADYVDGLGDNVIALNRSKQTR